MSGLLRRIKQSRAADDGESPPEEQAAPPESAPTTPEPAAVAPAPPIVKDPDRPAGLDPATEDVPAPTGRRARLRRRLRFLRRAREVSLRDLGGVVYEVHRTGGGDMTAHADLIGGKVKRLTDLDAEAGAIETALSSPRDETVLFQPGVGGTCDFCGELYGSAAHFCSNCGSPTGSAVRATPATIAPAGRIVPPMPKPAASAGGPEQDAPTPDAKPADAAPEPQPAADEQSAADAADEEQPADDAAPEPQPIADEGPAAEAPAEPQPAADEQQPAADAPAEPQPAAGDQPAGDEAPTDVQPAAKPDPIGRAGNGHGDTPGLSSGDPLASREESRP